jgi:hypothetical protein
MAPLTAMRAFTAAHEDWRVGIIDVHPSDSLLRYAGEHHYSTQNHDKNSEQVILAVKVVTNFTPLCGSSATICTIDDALPHAPDA